MGTTILELVNDISTLKIGVVIVKIFYKLTKIGNGVDVT